ncbi:MAG: alpha/beta hydrolase [Bacilli bacterium]|nr:alpha/beta hydrolase [Bacilli bacterium]
MKKILLIHGWNYNNYYGRIDTNAWYNRQAFVDALAKDYIVKTPDLPGFGLTKEPNVKKYSLDDYANFIYDYIKDNDFHPDYILGYSFGGAVAVTYYKKYGNVKLILVSPALIRNQKASKAFIKTPNFIKPIRNYLRDLYLIYKVKTPEMVYGTKFLRNTYQDIVRVELASKLEAIKPNDFIIIYGNQDNMVDPSRMLSIVSKKIKNRIYLINNGGHDIATTHTKELIKIINDYIKK